MGPKNLSSTYRQQTDCHQVKIRHQISQRVSNTTTGKTSPIIGLQTKAKKKIKKEILPKEQSRK